jgi:hypothetical protein
MRKYRSYFFLLFLVIVFLIIGYIFLKKEPKNVEIIEINFISNHSVVEKMNDYIPVEIISFSSIYNQNDSIDYISRISFKRTDIGNYFTDSLNNYKFRIDQNLKIEDADKMFSEENKTKKATEKMFLKSEGTNNSILNDTSGTRCFYLVPINDQRVNGSNKYFDNYQRLKEYIDEELKIGTLFKEKRNNVITIILDNQNIQFTESEKEIVIENQEGEGYENRPVNLPIGNVKNIDSDNDGVYDSKDNCPQEAGSKNNKGCPKNIEVKLRKPNLNGDFANELNWNIDLKNRNLFKLNLKLKSQNGGETFFEQDVSGLNKYIVPDEFITGYNNKKVIVELEVEVLDNYITVNNNNVLKDAKFFCKTP